MWNLVIRSCIQHQSVQKRWSAAFRLCQWNSFCDSICSDGWPSEHLIREAHPSNPHQTEYTHTSSPNMYGLEETTGVFVSTAISMFWRSGSASCLHEGVCNPGRTGCSWVLNPCSLITQSSPYPISTRFMIQEHITLTKNHSHGCNVVTFMVKDAFMVSVFSWSWYNIPNH